ncbi:MAG: hypothetical protein U0Y10_01430 [Spirosomataceae bacterium]
MKRIFSLIFKKLPIRHTAADADLHLLNTQEIRSVRQHEKAAIILAAVIGMNGVLLLYLPQYWHPDWFPISHFKVLGFVLDISIGATIYGVLLSSIEVYLLYILNLYCAHEIAVVTGFIDKDSINDVSKTNTLLDISLEKKNKDILRYGIDPYQGLSKQAIFLMGALFSLKAALSNVAVKLLLSRLLGRYAVREVLDLAGIPIFAFWNAVAVRVVLREARVVIMGQNLIERLLQRIPADLHLSETDHELLYDTLQFIAISKRDYHRNHYYLTYRILEQYQIAPKQKHVLSDDYFDHLHQAPPAVANLCKMLILTGFMLDGSLSTRERNRLQLLHRRQVLDETFAQLRKWTHNFFNGKGIEPLMDKYLTLR